MLGFGIEKLLPASVVASAALPPRGLIAGEDRELLALIEHPPSLWWIGVAGQERAVRLVGEGQQAQPERIVRLDE